MLDLNHLVVFESVARLGSFTAAAAELSSSQPSVSKQLKQLESSLKLRLLERSSRGVRLTEAGELLADRARRLVALMNDTAASIDDLQRLRSGKLTLAASPTIATYLLPALLVRYRIKYPGIRLQFEIEQSSTMYSRLSDGILDLALTETEPTEPLLLCSTFMRDAMVATAAPGKLKKTKMSLSDFVRNGLILRAAIDGRPSFVERALRAKRCDVEPALQLASSEAVKEAVAAGLGVAFLPSLVVRNDLKSGRLSRVQVTGWDLRRPYYCVRHRASRESKAAIAFLCMLKHAARGSLPGLDQPLTPRTPRA